MHPLRLLGLLPLVALAGCEGGKVTIEGDTAVMSDTDADTDADSDTDTDADSDSDTDADTDADTDTDVERTTLTFVLDGETDADALQLDWLTDAFAVLGPLDDGSIVGGSASVDVATPDTDDLLQITAGLWGRYAIPYVFVDDGSGDHDADEELRGVGTVWVLYLTGDIPIEYGALGVVDGWNAILVVEGETPVVYPLDAIPLSINLTPTFEANLAGTLGEDIDGNPRLALLPSTVFEGGSVLSLLFNQGLDGAWGIPVSGAPPPDHVTNIDGSGFYGAIEVPVAFDDQNGDSFPSSEAELVGPACAGADVAALLWIDPPTDPIFGYSLASIGLSPGWLPVRANDAEGFVPLSTDEASTLTIGGCSFE